MNLLLVSKMNNYKKSNKIMNYRNRFKNKKLLNCNLLKEINLMLNKYKIYDFSFIFFLNILYFNNYLLLIFFII